MTVHLLWSRDMSSGQTNASCLLSDGLTSCVAAVSPVSVGGQVWYWQPNPQPPPTVQQHSCWLVLVASRPQVPRSPRL